MKLLIKPHQCVFFTSDSHYNHTNICRGVSSWTELDHTRDFNIVTEMNSALIESINESIKEDDILFHMGDWSFGGYNSIAEFRNQIKCKNIHLLLGNHDHHIENDKEGICQLFASVNNYMKLELTIYEPNLSKPIKQILILSHYPIASWQDMNKGVIHLHGHTHLPSTLKIHDGRSMDIGLDGNNFQVYSLSEINKIMENQPISILTN